MLSAHSGFLDNTAYTAQNNFGLSSFRYTDAQYNGKLMPRFYFFHRLFYSYRQIIIL